MTEIDTSYRSSPMPNETRLAGRGVSSCATCDGSTFQDEHVAVVGGGESVLDEATFLSRFAKSVTVVHPRDEMWAWNVTPRIHENPKIRLVGNSVAEDVIGADRVERLKIRNVRSSGVSLLPVTGVFIAAGRALEHAGHRA